jgi:para-aminobenzoate synthetase component 1
MRQRLLDAPYDGWVSPATAFDRLFTGESRAVFLDCGIHAKSGISVVASGSRLVTADVASNTITVDGASVPGTIFDFLRAQPAIPDDGVGFRLGWAGWLGYGLGAQTLSRPTVSNRAPEPGSKHPDAALLYIDRAITFDHATGTVTLLALGDGWSGELGRWRETVTATLSEATEPKIAVTHVASVAEWAYSDAEYLEMIRECQRRIHAGDAYQLCLTNEVRVKTSKQNHFETYQALRLSSPTHHGSYFTADGITLLSASPEQFLVVSPAGLIESKPIKGTAPRGSTIEEDERLTEQLLASDKERAENLMIVDLVRNDIAKVSEIGSVSVPSLLAVETYAHVHQLVSTVQGQLKRGLTAVDAVAACFPAGSMTGAPKHSAVSILEGLERRARGVYAGAFGYFGLNGRVDLAMIIRTIVFDRHAATIGAGGGITALSVPEDELAEVKLKAAALLAVLKSA